MYPVKHKIQNVGWLRAAVLGANDGIVSTTSLILGVAASGAGHGAILVAGSAGLVAGAMSMATGEYVSVASQADAEKAAIEEEKDELESYSAAELQELAAIYVRRGLDADLANQVAKQLTKHDPLGAHARDELGISEIHAARPLQAAIASAISFALGAALPLLVAFFTPHESLMPVIAICALTLLAGLGALAARSSGAKALPSALRVVFWSALALALTFTIGKVSQHF